MARVLNYPGFLLFDYCLKLRHSCIMILTSLLGRKIEVKKVIAAVLGALLMVGSVTTAEAGVIKIPFYNGAQESAHGNTNKANISNTSTLIKAGSGFVGEYCSTGAGTSSVTFYDSATTGAAAASNLIYTIAATTAGTCVVLELPYNNGLVAVTGGGTTLIAVAYR